MSPGMYRLPDERWRVDTGNLSASGTLQVSVVKPTDCHHPRSPLPTLRCDACQSFVFALLGTF